MKYELDNIKSVGNATSSDIVSGKIALVKGEVVTGTSDAKHVIFLGTGTSFDVTQYDGYENFTIDNFIIMPSNSSLSAGGNYTQGSVESEYGNATTSLTKRLSYVPSSGSLSAYYSMNTTLSIHQVNWKNSADKAKTVDISVAAYLIY